MFRVFNFGVAFFVIAVCCCNKPEPVNDSQSKHLARIGEKSSDDDLMLSAAPNRVEDASVSVLSRVESFSKVSMPPADFIQGHVDRIETTELVVEPTDYGYVVTFPSRSPIPTPTIVGGRVYASGGFSSESFHCLDLASGKPLWEVRLDDDGPSTGIPCEDLILLGTESCTVFALRQETGELAWSAYLGDPLLSAPATADGRMVTVYPAASAPPQALAKLTGSPPPEPESLLGQISPSHESDNSIDVFTMGGPMKRVADLLEPTHLAVCMDAKSGEVQWRTWIDSDCLSNPVIAGADVYIASLAGTLYQLSIEDGSVRSARRLTATSTPLVIDDSIYITRRREVTDGAVQEYLSFLRRDGCTPYFASTPVDADYLQASIQMNSDLQNAALAFEQLNGFGGGGFGGGFGASQGGLGGGGSFRIPDDVLDAEVQDSDSDSEATTVEGSHDNGNGIDYSVINDLLGYTEVQAAENIGLGSASTIQGFAGSVTIGDAFRLYNTMGDRIVCTSRRTGKEIWTLPIDGDLAKLGGHLASPPVLEGNRLFFSTVEGRVMEVNAETGHQVEIMRLDAQFRFRPVLTPNAIIVTSQDGRLFCLTRSVRLQH